MLFRRLQGILAGLPVGRADLVRVVAGVVQGFKLAHQFFAVAPDAVQHHFLRDQFEIRVDDEGAAIGVAHFTVVNAEIARDAAGIVRGQQEAHVGQKLFVLVPGQMGEFGIGGYRDEFRVERFELLLLICQIREFGRSDEGEVARVKE